MIEFQSVRWKNLLSTGNAWTEISLNQHQNTLIMGENGSGKSTMLDAITFVLYGKPFRKINKPQLVSSINNGDCLVEIKFKIGTKQYEVRRGIKPAIFQIYQDGDLIPAPAAAKDYQEILEGQILGFNYKSFCQVVILGSSTFVPFMQLPAAQRREIIEDLLDISIFGQMNEALKGKISDHKSETSSVSTKISMKEQYIQLQKQTLKDIEKSNETETDAIQEKIREHTKERSDIQSEIEQLTSENDKIVPELSERPKVEANLGKAKNIERKVEDKISQLEKQLRFLHEKDDCPTCEQSIPHEFKQGAESTKSAEKQKLSDSLVDLQAKIDGYNERIDVFNKIQAGIDERERAITAKQLEINGIKRVIENLEEQMNRVGSSRDTTEIKKGLDEAATELKEAEAEREVLVNRSEVYKIVSGLLKDSGIKTLIVKQYLPIINQLVNQYLAKLDFFVKFNLDENFDEKILSRHRDAFSYSSFSEGEKSRIDLALLLTWRAVARMKNSCATNLLILDEVFDSSLDDGGLAEVTKILYNLGEDQNIFVISHKGDQIADKFKNTLRFEKVRGFSKIAA